MFTNVVYCCALVPVRFIPYYPRLLYWYWGNHIRLKLSRIVWLKVSYTRQAEHVNIKKQGKWVYFVVYIIHSLVWWTSLQWRHKNLESSQISCFELIQANNKKKHIIALMVTLPLVPHIFVSLSGQHWRKCICKYYLRNGGRWVKGNKPMLDCLKLAQYCEKRFQALTPSRSWRKSQTNLTFRLGNDFIVPRSHSFALHKFKHHCKKIKLI